MNDCYVCHKPITGRAVHTTRIIHNRSHPVTIHRACVEACNKEAQKLQSCYDFSWLWKRGK